MRLRDPLPSIYEPIDLETFGLLVNGSDRKFELFDGVIRMTGPATLAHGRVRTNLLMELADRYDGTGFCPLMRFGVRIEQHSFLLPQVAVFPRDLDPHSTAGAPVVVAETHALDRYDRERDERIDLYRRVASLRIIIVADPHLKHVQAHVRLGTRAWRDEVFLDGCDVSVPELGLTLRHDEIFARD
jgi:hypothetical protein